MKLNGSKIHSRYNAIFFNYSSDINLGTIAFL